MPERCFIVYSKSRFLKRADFLCVKTPIFTPKVGYMNSRSYVIFLTYYWRTLSAVRSAGQRGGNGVCRAGQIGTTEGTTEGENFKKIGVQHGGKIFFARFF